MTMTGTALADTGHLPSPAEQRTPARKKRTADVGANSRMREKRKNDRIVIIPRCVNKARRKRLEAVDLDWLMFFFAEATGEESRYTYEFTEQQLEMAKAIALAIAEGGDQAIAANRASKPCCVICPSCMPAGGWSELVEIDAVPPFIGAGPACDCSRQPSTGLSWSA